MTDWKKTGLCLCRPTDALDGGLCLRGGYRLRKDATERYRPSPGAVELPLLAICETALYWRESGTRSQVLILHDATGRSEVGQAEWFGSPVSVWAVEICSLDRITHVDILLALAMGFDQVMVQRLPDPDRAQIQRQECDLVSAMGGGDRVRRFQTCEALQQELAKVADQVERYTGFVRVGGSSRRAIARACATALLPAPHKRIKLPADAPYGRLELNSAACTLCQNCVWLCPTDALSVGEHKSELNFVENRCIQCGICRSVCPEDALKLQPGMDLSPKADQSQTLYQGEPFHCTSCGEPFAVKTMMERLLARIKDGAGVTASPQVQQLIPMCDTCRDQRLQRWQQDQDEAAVQAAGEIQPSDG